MLLFVIFLMFIALIPCFIVWVIAFKFFPQQYRTTSLKMTGVCFLLSLAAGFVLDVELEGGALSGVVAVSAFSFLWAMFLALINFLLGKRLVVGWVERSETQHSSGEKP